MPADMLLGYMLKGGFFMYPILLCSIVSLAIFFEKLRVLAAQACNTTWFSG